MTKPSRTTGTFPTKAKLRELDDGQLRRLIHIATEWRDRPRSRGRIANEHLRVAAALARSTDEQIGRFIADAKLALHRGRR